MNTLSLRTKFVLIVLVGAVLPLAIVGWWLTGSAVRSGRALLRTQLDASITRVMRDVREQWTQRGGELQLLANNSAVRSVVSSPSVRLTTVDSLYLAELFATFHEHFPSLAYVDVQGRERWSAREAVPVARVDGPAERLTSGLAATDRRAAEVARRAPIFSIVIPVTSDDGRALGTLRAKVRLKAVLTSDSSQRAVSGASFGVLAEGSTLLSSAPDSIDFAAEPLASWERVSRSLESTPLQFVLAAPAAPFVQPFESAARIGLSVLMSVALIALLVTTVLTSRVTGAIERMVVAAEGVAAGDLNGKVEERGRDELARLAGAFNAMTESLRRTLAELSQQRALAAVGEFAASLSHEVRNSLTAMRIDLHHVRRQVADDHPVTPLVARSLETVRRLDSTVTGALRVARSGQTRMSRVDLVALLRRSMNSARPSFAASEATLEPLVTQVDPLELDVDAVAIEQLFLNLLLNAAQALHAGGIARVQVESEQQRVVVRISDNGSGIESGVLDEAGGVLRSTKPGGTGLGLPIARRIAAAHGGELRIDTSHDGGTTVIVTLPVRA